VSVQVDVNGHAHAASLHSAPRGGHTSFTREALERWRETATGCVWAAASHALNDVTLSYELVVHSQARIVDILLSHMVAKDGGGVLPALCAVLAAAARDLLANFVEALPQIFFTFARVASTNASEPPALQTLFRCVLAVLRTLHTHLLDRMPWILQESRDLRYHPVYHIRCFAARVSTAGAMDASS
jgi:hypothetical protein